MRTSYSALQTFKNCPLKYKYRQIDKLREAKSPETIFGSIIHASLKFMFERNPLYPTENEVIDFFNKLWDESKNNLNLFKEQEEMYRKDGINILAKFYKKNPPWNFNVLNLESYFEVEIEDPKNKEKHILTGKFDRIDKDNEDNYEIIDYKTDKKMPPQKQIDENFQMSIYHLGLIKQWPHLDPKRIKLSLYFLKHGEKITTKRDERQLEEIKNFVLKTISEIDERIKNNSFEPRPSQLCDYCGYRQICPMWRHLYEKKYANEKIKNQEELDKAVKEYFDLKSKNEENNKRIDELKLIILAFMEEQGVNRVFGDIGYITKKLSERNIYDMKKIKEILEEIGRWDEVVRKKQYTILTASKKKVKE